MAYLFQASILTGSGGYDVTGPITASTTVTATSFHGSGASLTGISADAVDITGSAQNVDLNLVGTDRYDESGKASLAGGAAKILVFNPSTKALKCSGSISGAAGLSGASLTINNSDIVTQAGAIVAPTTLSGKGGLSAASLTINGSSVISQAKALGNVTTISGASSVSAAKLTINGSDIVSQAKALGNVTTISGASSVSAASLTINGNAIVSQAGAIAAPTTLSGKGGLSAASLTINGSSVISQAKALGNVTTISGASSVSAASLTINGSSIISQAKALGNVTTISGASSISAASLTVNGQVVRAQGGNMELGVNGENDVDCNGIFNLKVGHTVNYKLTGSATAASLQGNCAPLEAGDSFVVVNNGSADATVELPNTQAKGWMSGRVITIKRHPAMTADVVLSGNAGATPLLIDADSATVRLDSPGAAVSLIASGSTGAGAYWLLY